MAPFVLQGNGKTVQMYDFHWCLGLQQYISRPYRTIESFDFIPPASGPQDRAKEQSARSPDSFPIPSPIDDSVFEIRWRFVNE